MQEYRAAVSSHFDGKGKSLASFLLLLLFFFAKCPTLDVWTMTDYRKTETAALLCSLPSSCLA